MRKPNIGKHFALHVDGSAAKPIILSDCCSLLGGICIKRAHREDHAGISRESSELSKMLMRSLHRRLARFSNFMYTGTSLIRSDSDREKAFFGGGEVFQT